LVDKDFAVIRLLNRVEVQSRVCVDQNNAIPPQLSCRSVDARYLGPSSGRGTIVLLLL